MPNKTRILTVTCPGCGKEIYSRAPHDYRTCGCACATMVDGGFSGYIRYGGKLRPFLRYRFVSATKKELYNDWNRRIDKFGIIAKRSHK